MKVMRRLKRVGLIQVHTQQFCDSCLPYPENIIAVISRKLPEIALKKNLVLLTIIKVRDFLCLHGISHCLFDHSD